MFKVGDTVRRIDFSGFGGQEVGDVFIVTGLEGPDGMTLKRLDGTPVVDSDGTLEVCNSYKNYVRVSSKSSVEKDTNPKDAVGTQKPPMSTVSGPVMLEIGVAMLEGARKYGRHNYRVSGVRASVYFDAAMRHLLRYYEGEDIDPDSGLPHITKAMASLAVLRDAEINETVVDDRPPRSNSEWFSNLQTIVDGLFEKYPDSVEAHTHVPN
jgi:hypothetical protein